MRSLIATVIAETEQDAARILYDVYGDVALLIEPLISVVGKGWRFRVTFSDELPIEFSPDNPKED